MAKAVQGGEAGASLETAVLRWLEQNKRLLTWVTVAVALAGAIGWWTVVAGRRKAAAAEQEVQVARAQLETGDLARGASALNQIIERYGGTPAAHQAVLLINQVRLTQGQATLAAQELSGYAARAPASFRAQAHELLGGALEDAGEPARAAAAYEEGAGGARLGIVAARLLLDAGRAHLAAGDTTKAAAVYRRILATYGETPAAVEARVRLAELTKGPSGS